MHWPAAVPWPHGMRCRWGLSVSQELGRISYFSLTRKWIASARRRSRLVGAEGRWALQPSDAVQRKLGPSSIHGQLFLAELRKDPLTNAVIEPQFLLKWSAAQSREFKTRTGSAKGYHNWLQSQ